MDVDRDGFWRIDPPGRLCVKADADPPCDVLLHSTPESRQDAPTRPDHPLAWLGNEPPADGRLPDHLCWTVARLTVARWALGRWAEDLDREATEADASGYAGPRPLAELARAWPLPVSAPAWRIWAGRNGVPLRTLPKPPLESESERWLGLAVERRIEDAGTVVLFGYTDPAGALWRDPEPQRRTLPSADDDTRTRREEALTALEHRLIRWYQKRLQGQRVGPGRPVGSRDHAIEAVRAAYRAALADLRRGHISPTRDRIAQYMGYRGVPVSRETLTSYLDEGALESPR